MTMASVRRQVTAEYPHLDARWAEDLLLALRVREVSGARIGEILAEADAHCAATGERAENAFGAASTYAASLDFAGQDRAPARVTGSSLGLLAAGLLGAAVVTLGGNAVIERTVVHVRAADVLVAAAVLVAAWVIYRRLEWVLTHAALTSVGLGLLCAGFVAVFVWGGPVLADAPALPSLLLGLALLIGPAVLQTPGAWRMPADEVVSPGAPEPGRRSARAIALVATWLLPVAILGMLAASWLLVPR